jgi:hypothetical protein
LKCDEGVGSRVRSGQSTNGWFGVGQSLVYSWQWIVFVGPSWIVRSLVLIKYLMMIMMLMTGLDVVLLVVVAARRGVLLPMEREVVLVVDDDDIVVGNRFGSNLVKNNENAVMLT